MCSCCTKGPASLVIFFSRETEAEGEVEEEAEGAEMAGKYNSSMLSLTHLHTLFKTILL